MTVYPDKRLVAASFGRAASSYDAAAQIQREIGEQLLTTIPNDLNPEVILDLGSGTGYFAELLQYKYPKAKIICLDLAENMLAYARGKRPLDALYICADAEAIPLQNSSIDLVFSSLSIQWCENHLKLLAGLRRVLKPQGNACIATLGPDTLFELRHAWRQVDNYVHVNSFASMAELQAAAMSQNFSQFRYHTVKRVLKYSQLQQLTRELKAIGAHNMNPGQSLGLSGRKRIELFRSAYEKYRSEGFLPATYEIYYLSFLK